MCNINTTEWLANIDLFNKPVISPLSFPVSLANAFLSALKRVVCLYTYKSWLGSYIGFQQNTVLIRTFTIVSVQVCTLLILTISH